MRRFSFTLIALALVLSFFAVQAPIQAATPKASGMTATVLASQLNIRDGAGIRFGILGYANWGESLSVIGRNERANWLKVAAADGTVGWVSAYWVRLSQNVSRTTLPIVE